MELNAAQAYEILKAKEVGFLHHANSLQTSCSFLRSGSLMSRGAVARSGLRQTPQDSDGIDQKYGVWFDVFTDSVDIHNRANRRNKYGPVLFKISLEIMKCQDMPPLWITKKNPTKWIENEPQSERWFTSIEELNSLFYYGNFDQMIVFRHIGGVLPITNYISAIILDDPNLEYCGLKYYDLAAGALFASAAAAGMQITISKRICNQGCACNNEYAYGPNIVAKHFWP